MIRLECDYLEGAHPAIMDALVKTNMEQTCGYGLDPHCEHARNLIQEACCNPDAAVHFLVGGTQTNKTVIGAALRPYQGVIAAESGHINVHETGAIEACGHKVLTLPSDDGKITAGQVDRLCHAHFFAQEGPEHMVQPAMVYISNPTENGTVYSAKELGELRRVCDKYRLYLFLDGARLSYGLACPNNDLSLEFLSRTTDVFYIGGTKCGALFGEAAVISNPSLNKDFRYAIKQNGGMLAKGRLLGIQFETLFTDNLYFSLAAHAIRLSEKLRLSAQKMNIPFRYDSPTNQQFLILPDSFLEELQKEFSFEIWEKTDGTHSAARFCTSWATKEEYIDLLIKKLEKAPSV